MPIEKLSSPQDIHSFRLTPGEPVELSQFPTKLKTSFSRKEGEKQFSKLRKRLNQLQELLYAESKHALLVVFQAMDAGGKDSTTRHVFSPLDPQGVHVAGFKAPTAEEYAHDFLWRVHAETPAKGQIQIFSRSHYEDVLIARVKGLVPESRWSKRYRHINEFERMLADEGTTILKFFLHISKDYQKKRLERRLQREDKIWKFYPEDVAERKHWDDYQQAYEVALSRCTTDDAPWYIIPAERKWLRNLLVAQVVVDTLEGLEMQYPEPDFDPADIVIE
jgi:PPK2 family polyphosphate:nucleotide phosphotransferase